MPAVRCRRPRIRVIFHRLARAALKKFSAACSIECANITLVRRAEGRLIRPPFPAIGSTPALIGEARQ
ncbi:MAG TPA: hypothetical protein DEP05_03820 [Betaproteobacteria bacterium]|nr:hypothetical protein [Betaproteobacteria bacterium]